MIAFGGEDRIVRVVTSRQSVNVKVSTVVFESFNFARQVMQLAAHKGDLLCASFMDASYDVSGASDTADIGLR